MGTGRPESVVRVEIADIEELERHRHRIAQINLDAFTTGTYTYLRDMTADGAITYLRNLLDSGGTGFFAFDSGERSHPSYPIGFLFATPLAKDKLLHKTPFINSHSINRSSYLSDLAVDLGHRGRGVASRLVETYLTSLDPAQIDYAFVRTNESDLAARNFYVARGFTDTGVVAELEGYGKKHYYLMRVGLL